MLEWFQGCPLTLRLLEFLPRRHSECAVESLGVVIMDLVMDGSDAIVERFEPVEVTELLLESPEEGFLVTILPGVRLVALGRQDAMDQQPDPAVRTVILAALIRMKDNRRPAQSLCILESVNH